MDAEQIEIDRKLNHIWAHMLGKPRRPESKWDVEKLLWRKPLSAVNWYMPEGSGVKR